MNEHVLITGATGFIGRALLQRMLAENFYIPRAAVRTGSAAFPEAVEVARVEGLAPDADWQAALGGVTKVVHTAARVHVMQDRSSDPLLEYRRVNVEGTLNLAQQAAEAGVRRFVYLSSIKVNGEESQSARPFRPEDVPAPEDPYGVTKWEAEQGLEKLSDKTGMEVVIIRPPLVYGPGVKGNFARIMGWVARGVPLPLADVQGNRRSLVALDNLVDLIITCIEHDAAANQVFLVSDGEDLSTAELLRRLARAMGQSARLFPVPQGLFELGLKILGKADLGRRLCGSLQVDISKTRELLGWLPPISVDEGLRRAVTPLLAVNS